MAEKEYADIMIAQLANPFPEFSGKNPDNYKNSREFTTVIADAAAQAALKEQQALENNLEAIQKAKEQEAAPAQIKVRSSRSLNNFDQMLAIGQTKPVASVKKPSSDNNALSQMVSQMDKSIQETQARLAAINNEIIATNEKILETTGNIIMIEQKMVDGMAVAFNTYAFQNPKVALPKFPSAPASENQSPENLKKATEAKNITVVQNAIEVRNAPDPKAQLVFFNLLFQTGTDVFLTPSFIKHFGSHLNSDSFSALVVSLSQNNQDLQSFKVKIITLSKEKNQATDELENYQSQRSTTSLSMRPAFNSVVRNHAEELEEEAIASSIMKR